MSKTACMYPVIAAIAKADDILGPKRVWQPCNPMQKTFLENFYYGPGAISDIPEIESLASFSADDINAFLAKRGFQIALSPFPEHGFGTASVIDILLWWQEKGIRTTLQLHDSGRSVHAVRIETGVTFSRSDTLGVIATIKTKHASGDTVSIALCHEAPEGMELLSMAQKQSTLRPCVDFKGIVFPMVNLSDRPDISWLQRMKTIGQDNETYEINQALQQTTFKMNEMGAHAKSAVAVGMRLLTGYNPSRPFVVDRPFLLWINRPGLGTLFAAHITEEHFKDPRSLE